MPYSPGNKIIKHIILDIRYQPNKFKCLSFTNPYLESLPMKKHILLLALFFLPYCLFAQGTYPNKTVTIVVTYAPGGLGDMLARQIAEQLTTRTKQSFIVENKPGATGALGSRYVTKSKPDGYTLLLGQTGEMVINTFVAKDLGYDPSKDLKPIAIIGEVPLTLVVPANSPYTNLSELIKGAKANPGKMTYASSGTATPGHLAAAALSQAAGIDMAHAPYKGAGPAMTDVLGGHVDMFFPSTPSILQFVESKKIRALAVSSTKRTTALPDIKTVAEEGIKDFSFTLWGGVYAPTGTSEEILNYLNTNINIILEDPSFKKNLENVGILVRRNSRIEFGDFMKSEFTKYAKIVKAIDLKVE